MDANQLDRLNLDLRRFFDFKNHNHIYSFFIWKGDFSIGETKTAATYADIADRFEAAIAWIKEVRKQDRPPICPDCGAEDDRVPRVLSFAVMTGDEEVFRTSYDDGIYVTLSDQERLPPDNRNQDLALYWHCCGATILPCAFSVSCP